MAGEPIRKFASTSPAKFVPIAEDAGLIDRIGQWALRRACADLARWPRSIRCAVNVSALQFANPDLPTIVASALAHSGVAPSRLELEITESVFLNDSQGTDAMFKALKRVGVRLALDDFGTGYSSLGYLKKAPFDKIKIDRSFVQGATEEGSRNGAIIASITRNRVSPYALAAVGAPLAPLAPGKFLSMAKGGPNAGVVPKFGYSRSPRSEPV